MLHRRLAPALILLPLALFAAADPPSPANERRTPIVAAVEKIGPGVVNISAERIVVTTANGKEYEAEVKGADADNDLAVLTNQRVRTLDDLSRAVESGFGRSSLVMVVVRGGYGYTLTFGME